MKTHQGQSERDVDWQPCPSGSLAGFSSKQKAEARTGQLVRLTRNGAVLGLMLVAIFVGWQQLSGSQQKQLGGLGCLEVLSQEESFFSGRLAPDYRLRVLEHLENCAHCKRKYQETATELGMELVQQSRDPGAVIISGATHSQLLSSIVPLLR